VQATVFSEELFSKTQTLARLRGRLCERRAEGPGRMNSAGEDRTDPAAEGWLRSGSQISE